MSKEVVLPRLGDTVDEVVVIEWLVEVGTHVAQGEPILRVETDKVEVDVEAPFTGVVSEILVGQGDEVKTGAVLCLITPDG